MTYAAIEWSDFNVDLHSTIADASSKEYTDIVGMKGNKMIDLRPYMIPRPFTIFENDSI